MTGEVALRVWRGDVAACGFVDHTVPVADGEVVLDSALRSQGTGR